jgi:4-amino-4-deoxy-L-arabinose transferase-like glycosyltransferase
MSVPPGLRRAVTRERFALLLILVLAASLRLVALGDVPPGPGYDELQDARLSERVLAGEWAIYYADNFGQEPLYPALAALSVRLLGWSVIALRLPGALLGVLAVLALYLVARRLAGRSVALLAATLQAVSFWPLIETRMALETTLLPPMAALGVLFLARGLQGQDEDALPSRWPGPSSVAMALAGIFIGGQVYAYTPGRAAPALVPLLLVYLFLLDRRTFRRRWRGLLVLFVVTLLVVLPLVVFLRAHPESEQRVDQLAGPMNALRRGDPLPALRNTLGTLGMLALRGEPQWLYNVAGRPLFDPLTALLFMTGLGVCVLAPRDWRRALPVLWLAVGLMPAFISPPAASFTHTLIAQPAVYLILGVGLQRAGVWLSRWRGWAGTAMIGMLVVLNAGLSWQAYFVTWAGASEVQELYQGGVTAVAREVDGLRPGAPVAIGAPYISFWHPWNAIAFELVSRNEEAKVRWFNPAGAWIWPEEPEPVTFYFPSDPLGPQQFDPVLEALFRMDATPLETDNDLLAAFRVGQPAALDRHLAELDPVPLRWPPEWSHLAPPQFPLVFGNRFALLGVEYEKAAAAPGDELHFFTYWQVLAEDPSPVVAFTHLTSDGQNIWGQQDWLDVRAEGLRRGDRFVQMHRLPIKPETPTGQYRIQLGLYGPDTLVRLPIGPDAVDRVWVGEVEVRPISSNGRDGVRLH